MTKVKSGQKSKLERMARKRVCRPLSDGSLIFLMKLTFYRHAIRVCEG